MSSICSVCGTGDTPKFIDDILTCAICGSVINNRAPETIDDGKALHNSRRGVTKKKEHEITYTLRKDVVVKVYIQTLQSCLVRQVKALINMGINPALESVVRKIWFRVIAVSRIFNETTISNAIYKLRQIRQVYYPEKNVDKFFEEQVSSLFDARNGRIWRYLLWYLLDPEILLYILYTSLVWLREAVTPMDLALWVLNGNVPYYNMYDFSVDVSKEFNIEYPADVFHIKRLPMPNTIETGSLQLCTDIGLKIPVPNIPLHLHRTALILGFPIEVADIAIELHRMLTWDRMENKINAYCISEPFSLIYTHLIIALKFCYGLDGRTKNKCPFDIQYPTHDWTEWAEEVMSEALRDNDFYTLNKDLLRNCSDQQIARISHRCMDVYFRYLHSVGNFDEVVEDIQKMSYLQKKPKHNDTSNKLVTKQKHKNEGRETKIVASFDDTKKAESSLNPDSVMFSNGDDFKYVPDLFSLPCPIYWRSVYKDGNVMKNSVIYALDYAAVVSVISLISGLSTPKINIYVYMVECIMKRQEELCYYIDGHPRRRCRKLSILNAPSKLKRSQKELMKELKENDRNMKRDLIKEATTPVRIGFYISPVTDWVSIAFCCIDQVLSDSIPGDWYGGRDGFNDESYFAHSAIHNFEFFLKKKEINRLHRVTKRPMEEAEEADVYTNPLINHRELLRCVKIAREMGQPFIMASPVYEYGNCIFGGKRKFFEDQDNYESDVTPCTDSENEDLLMLSSPQDPTCST